MGIQDFFSIFSLCVSLKLFLAFKGIDFITLEQEEDKKKHNFLTKSMQNFSKHF